MTPDVPMPVDWSSLLRDPHVDRLVTLAIEEDLGSGDLTSEALFREPLQTRARLVARSTTVVCGLPLAREILRRFDAAATLDAQVSEGALCAAGTTLALITADTRALLGAERPLLNFLMRLCGIAALTHATVARVPAGSRCRIYDTRKTMPGWRALDKAAVRTGGGENHRMGLYDAVLIKDNHLAASASITDAVGRVRAHTARSTIIEVEIDHLDQLEEAITNGADIILLDNFSMVDIAEAVRRARH
ncbi:MAG: carboxylating nicotinate-nucleotide diphosphorylase, partial [Myxococcota bacterium]